VDESAWISLIREAHGERAVTHFHAMMDGKPIVPASNAFGPCFERTVAPLRRYELGFDSQVLMEPSRIVRGLVPDSAAARAGLRNGDRIVKPVPQDAIQADQSAMLSLLIERNGRTFPMTYLPRGAVVPAYQWRRRPGVPDRACGL
jgi:membrane-associated protease RseP (regulator of RpoE activity)